MVVCLLLSLKALKCFSRGQIHLPHLQIIYGQVLYYIVFIFPNVKSLNFVHRYTQHTSKINVLCSSLNSKETLQNFSYLYKKKTQVVDIDHGIHKLKMKVAWNEKRKKTTSVFFLYKYRKWSTSLEFKLEHKTFILEVCHLTS